MTNNQPADPPSSSGPHTAFEFEPLRRSFFRRGPQTAEGCPYNHFIKEVRRVWLSARNAGSTWLVLAAAWILYTWTTVAPPNIPIATSVLVPVFGYMTFSMRNWHGLEMHCRRIRRWCFARSTETDQDRIEELDALVRTELHRNPA